MRIGTRGSALALEQARQVQAALLARGADSELVTFTTLGDKRLDASFVAIGAKGLFTAELEAALDAGTIDCAVHSLKDLPTEARGIVAVLPRADPRDVVVGAPLADLAPGARVGTSSLRRRAQLAAVRPDLEVVDLRGNVPTRVRKVQEGQVDSAILAAAGLLRLAATQHITAYLDPPDWLPAPGQGAIAVQARTQDPLLMSLNDLPTMRDVTAERALLAALDGGCLVPIGALVVAGVLHAFIADARGIVRGSWPVDPANPAAAGVALATKLRG
jgi:hydroxymethylbilane synthase